MKKSIMLLSTVAALALVTGCGATADPIRVGMDLRYPPFETVDGSNNPEGISVDVANAFGSFLNRETEVVNTNFGAIFPALDSGDIDVAIASISITPARQANYDFSNPYLYFRIITLVNKDFAVANNLTENSTTEALLAVPGATYAGIASQISATIPENNGKTVTVFQDLPSAIESVVQGTSDIFLMSPAPVVSGFKANRDKTMIVWDQWDALPIGMAFKKGNTDLVEKANEFIATFDDEGGLYDVLREDWDAIVLEVLEGRYGIDFYLSAE
jgi:polar amino acid transport system substrate-binding protein